MDELEDEGKKKDLGFLLNRAIDYLDEIGLTPAEKFKAEISDTLQRMIEKEKEYARHFKREKYIFSLLKQ